jgi:beta-lactamase class A
VKEILAQVSGLDLDPKQWPYVGAKGGNLPGDVTFSWYAEDSRGQAWVVSFQMSWPQFHELAARSWLLSIANQVFGIVARQP